ncbi:DUF1435 family protein, partial [Klebsiella pneumoniae]|uniref:DUF1435 family protein n=1 Tax=Klebsiella pneumoniae TaxID=573 RepID=UPI00287BBC81
GMLMSAAMIWHRQLRHFILLPSCVALIGGITLKIAHLPIPPPSPSASNIFVDYGARGGT